MTSQIFEFPIFRFLYQLAGMSPVLLVYAAAIFLGFTSLERHRRPAVFLMVGAGILLVATAGFPFVLHAVVLASQSRIGGAPTIAGVLPALTLVNSMVHAVGVGFLIAAALVDRNADRVSTN
jgi:hypothetical protein